MNKLLIICIALLPYRSLADSPADPFPYVAPSEYGSNYFAMIPGVRSYSDMGTVVDDGAFGVAYELLGDGGRKELWRVEGWYAFKVFLTSDGEYLVRMGDWATGNKPSKEDLAVAFYHKGILLKEYSTTDLIRWNWNVDATVSHYFWKSRDREYPAIAYNQTFLLKTIEDRVFEFDVTTGEISSVRKD